MGHALADATAPQVTPLLVDDADASHVFVSQLDYADGRQVLLSTVGNAWYRLHSNVVAYQFLDWATKGLFIGACQVSLSTTPTTCSWPTPGPGGQRHRPQPAVPPERGRPRQRRRPPAGLPVGAPAGRRLKVQFPYNGSGASTETPVNPQVTKAVGFDATLNKAQAGRNYGRATSLAVSRSSTTESRRSCGPATSPARGTVTKVQLDLRVTSNSAALPVQVCAVTESWTEGNGNGGAGDTSGVSWNNRSNGSRWRTAGGSYAANRCVDVTLPGTGAASVDITPIWQAWNTNAIANHGVLVRATADGTATIGSAEAAAAVRRSPSTASAPPTP